MKKLILSLIVAAFALATAVQADDAQQCPFAKAAAEKKSCCADQAKPAAGQKSCCADEAKTVADQKTCGAGQAKSGCQAQAKKTCCAESAKAKVAKKALSPKAAELAKK